MQLESLLPGAAGAEEARLQALWGAAALLALPVLAVLGAHLSRSQAELISSASAIGSVFAELFMVKSLLVFNPASQTLQPTASGKMPSRVSAEWQRTRVRTSS